MLKNKTIYVSLVSGTIAVGTIFLGSIAPTAMRESPREASSHRSSTTSIITQTQFKQFQRDGIIILDGVLTREELGSARDEVNSMLSTFTMNEQQDLSVRSDIVSNLSESIGDHQLPSLLYPALLHALRLVRSVPLELQNFGMNGETLGVPYTNQLACYDGSIDSESHYVPHRDAPESEESSYNHMFTSFLSQLLRPDMHTREVTIVLYLNDDIWGNVDI
jgi:hypothetical protein